MPWLYSSVTLTRGNSVSRAIEEVARSIRDCPVCEGVVSAIESTACELLRKVKPDLDPEHCRKALRSRLEGRPVEEIAKELGVDTEILREAVNTAIDLVHEAYQEALGRKRRSKK